MGDPFNSIVLREVTKSCLVEGKLGGGWWKMGRECTLSVGGLHNVMRNRYTSYSMSPNAQWNVFQKEIMY